LDGALFGNFFINDVRVLGEAVLLAKQALLANGRKRGRSCRKCMAVPLIPQAGGKMP